MWLMPFPKLTLKLNFKIIIITIFILCWPGSTHVDSSDMWLGPYPGLIPESSFKTMIIITFFLCWLESCLESTTELSFKSIITTTFIFMLTQVNSSQPDPWPSTLELSFKTMIIIILIIVYFSWTILELRVFYKDILEIKNKKYCLWKHMLSIPFILKVQNFTSKLFQR